MVDRPPDACLVHMWQAAPWPIAALDAQGRIVNGNPRFGALTNRDAASMVGLCVADLVRDREAWERAWASEQPPTADEGWPLPIGDVSFRATVERCEPNAFGIAALLFLSDPGPAQELRDSQSRWSEAAFRTVLDSLTFGVAVCNNAGEITFFNQRALTLVEPDPSPDGRLTLFPWSGPRGLFDPETGERAEHDSLPVIRALAGETVAETRLQLRTHSHPDGIPVGVSARPIRDATGARVGALAVMDDRTNADAADRERQLLESRVRESQRFESLAVLAGGIAHDFNNLLMGVLGNADTALAMLPADSAAHEAIAHVSKAALRAADLSRQMLAYAGQGRFTIETIDLSALVREMADLLQTTIPKTVELRLELDPDLPRTEGDVTQLRQVVMNLITNAGDACRERGGTIVVRTSAGQHSAAWLHTTYGAELDPGYYLRLEVEDDGTGMDAQTRRRVFDPFFTTKADGRGLGLAAALGVVRGLRGAIRVQSEPGRGTRFGLVLPARGRQRRPHTGPRPVVDDRWRATGTILVVDDEPLVRRATTRMLANLGFEVVAVENGHRALAWLQANAGTARAVLLDMAMPGLSGPEVFTRLRRLAPDLPVVMTSGREHQQVLDRLHDEGLAGFIPKPYRLADLRALLRTVLEAPTEP
ncbi:MAG: response regulator [Deltaproteobacteria bacterium]|nr:response regulator [Deltaproteobacteria bacterium]